MNRHQTASAILSIVVPILGICSPAPAADDTSFFESKIRPVLVKNCYSCHSAQASKVKGGFLLDTREGIRKGGNTGPAVVPGKADESLLLKALAHDGLKMPPGRKLSESVHADFRHWIEGGASDPRDATVTTVSRKITSESGFWAFQPPRKSKPPAVQADQWCRNEIDHFILAGLEAKGLRPAADADRYALIRRTYFDLIGLPPPPDQVEAFVQDQTSNAFDKVVDELLASAQFGERWGRHWLDVARFGESNGNADNTPFPHAWRYRDYVIGAFNKDKPFNRFITEQLAGDLLPASTPAQRDEQLIATGFLALTSKPRPQNNPNYRMDLVADQIDVTCRAVMGLTVMCARCHDHKFDPIPTTEYYALAGIFDSSVMLFGDLAKGGAKKKVGLVGGLHTLSDGNQAMGVKEGRPADCRVCLRGESQKRGDTAPRGFLSAVKVDNPPRINRSRSGRLELAHWLTSPDHPLTARVAVNRIWSHLFGEGLVRSVDNFGFLGESPSHPELLDYLAIQFVEDGWSFKKMIRTIVLSRTYQQGSLPDAENLQKDPDNVWLWRMSPRRLDAESIRDGIMAVSGKIDLTPPRKSLLTLTAGKAKANRKRTPRGIQESNHRSVYLLVRNGMPEMLALFDVANPSLVVGKREVTTVPAQALYLMNSPFVIRHAGFMANRLLARVDLDDSARVDLAFRLALSRPATSRERERTLAYLHGDGERTHSESIPAEAWSSFCQTLFASAEFRYLQ